ncbi:helix-turn-helix transcriptional regulator [Thalassolituus marinus]|uniref:Helix-turn-helix transcriptional regulator n=1 Tax=Thalassolituus marinus TaxID=671053 RepID=A0ABS7ZM80_9GAMM|nr:helix-turn-helix transcriptional regulator [Thalassolituus marinus]MCA6062313.1 helix-turn-helix transcriptional regulator [Thalassolituus marinus]
MIAFERLRDGEPSIDQIARVLNCSARTLQRRLQVAGTSYREELNLVRYKLARSYLEDPSLQIIDVAMLLGYSEHSVFTRAFREWSGKTPQDFRQQRRLAPE